MLWHRIAKRISLHGGFVLPGAATMQYHQRIVRWKAQRADSTTHKGTTMKFAESIRSYLFITLAFLSLGALAAACGDDGGVSPLDAGDELDVVDDTDVDEDADVDEDTDVDEDADIDEDTDVVQDTDIDEDTDAVGEATLTVRVTGGAEGSVLAGELPCDDGCVIEGEDGELVEVSAEVHPYGRIEWSADTCAGQSCSVAIAEGAELEVRFNLNHNAIFYTSEKFVPGTLGSLETADEHCARLAADAGLHHEEWVALLATESACPGATEGPCEWDDRLEGARGFVSLDMRAVFDDVEQLYNGLLWFPVRVNDRRESEPTPTVITGMGPALNTAVGRRCDDLTDPDGFYSWGRPTSIDADFIWQNSNARCNREESLLCASTDYDLPVEPIRGEGRLAFLSSTSWGPGGGISSADEVCQRDACEAGLTGSEDCDVSLGDERTFLALLDSGDIAAGSRFDEQGADYYRTDGLYFLPAASLQDAFVDLDLRTGLATTAGGERVTGDLYAWTGVFGGDCDGWLSATGSGEVGSYSDIARYFARSTGRSCAEAHRLYCLEQ